MKKNLFITGASGYVASRLLKTIDFERFGRVVCLSRSSNPQLRKLQRSGRIRFIKGSVTSPHLYATDLKTTDVVIHMAAATGKATPGEFTETNAVGTEVLAAECVRAEVPSLIYLSSIAAGFPDLKRYHYAETKFKGEEAVKRSGINYLILRPTIILGGGSGTWKALRALATGPVTPVFGSGRVKVQPIAAADLVDMLTAAIEADTLPDTTMDAGGPEVVTIEELIRAIRRAYTNKPAKIVRLPMAVVLTALRVLEPVLYSRLPFTTGQVASFRFDGTAGTNETMPEAYLNADTGLTEMIGRATEEERATRAEADMVRDCEVFCRHLTGLYPDEYVTDCYAAGIASLGLDGANAGRFDHMLATVAGRNRLFTRLADTYSAAMFGDSLLRKRLALLTAIIESTEGGFSSMLLDVHSGRSGAMFSAVPRIAAFAVSLAASLIVFQPMRFALGGAPVKHAPGHGRDEG